MAKMYMEASINDDQHLTEVVLEKRIKRKARLSLFQCGLFFQEY